MTILWIILAVILGIPFLLFLIFLIEPAIISLVFSWFLSLFVKNPPYVSMEEEVPRGKAPEGKLENNPRRTRPGA
jgi:hypothetical protein